MLQRNPRRLGAAGSSLFLACFALAVTNVCLGAAYYVDSSLKDLTAEQLYKVASPRAVQLYFEFQDNGVPAAGATEVLIKHITEVVSATGFFSTVSPVPVEDQAILSITINHLPVAKSVVPKSLVTGFTLGVVGSTFADEYVCTVDYRNTLNSPSIIKTTRQVIYTTEGLKKAPPETERSANWPAAFAKMARQVVVNGLNEAAREPEFSMTKPHEK